MSEVWFLAWGDSASDLMKTDKGKRNGAPEKQTGAITFNTTKNSPRNMT